MKDNLIFLLIRNSVYIIHAAGNQCSKFPHAGMRQDEERKWKEMSGMFVHEYSGVIQLNEKLATRNVEIYRGW